MDWWISIREATLEMGAECLMQYSIKRETQDKKKGKNLPKLSVNCTKPSFCSCVCYMLNAGKAKRNFSEQHEFVM